MNHPSAVHRGDDSFTAPELPATRSRRTMTAAHTASLILNKCFKVQTPAARDAEIQARWRGASVPGQAGALRAGLAPTRPPEACGGAQVGPRRPRRRAPDRPSALRGILYNSPSRSKRKRGARCRGRQAEVFTPGARGAPHAASRRRGKAPSARPARPLAKALDRGRSPSGSRERHQLRQLLQTPCPVSLQPGSRRRRAGAAGRAGKRASGEEKVPGDPSVARPAQPHRQHPCPSVINLGPPAARDPCYPPSSHGARGDLARGPAEDRPH